MKREMNESQRWYSARLTIPHTIFKRTFSFHWTLKTDEMLTGQHLNPIKNI